MDYRQFRQILRPGPGPAAASSAATRASSRNATVPGDPFALLAPPPPPAGPGFEDRLRDALDLLRCDLDAIADRNVPDRNLSTPGAPPDTPDLGSRWATPPLMARLYAESSALAVANSAARRRPPNQGPQPPPLRGLGQPAIVNTLVAAVRQMQQDWPTLQPADRVLAITNAANAALAALNVPGFTPQPTQDFATMAGAAMFQWSPTTWSFVVRTDIVACADQDDRLRNVDAARIANLILHECRHAEQVFFAARYSARRNSRGVGKDAATLVTEHQIPLAVAQNAIRQAFDRNVDAATVTFGRLMYNVLVVDGPDYAAIDQAVDPAMKKLRAAWNTADALWQKFTNQSPPGPLQRLAAARALDHQRSELAKRVTRVRNAYKAYRAIPTEKDAHEIGDTAWENFRNVVWSAGEAFD